jgi:hypothetical protein
VIAPDSTVWTSMEGIELVSSPASFGGYLIPKYPPDGAWHRFDPFGDEIPLGFDPGYHGPPVDGTRPLSQFNPIAYGGYDDEPYDSDPYTGNAHDPYEPHDWTS